MRCRGIPENLEKLRMHGCRFCMTVLLDKVAGIAKPRIKVLEYDLMVVT